MAGPNYIDDLKTTVHGIETRLTAARNKLAKGTTEQKSEALAALARLEVRRKDMVERLAKAKTDNAAAWSDMHRGLREEAEGIADTLDAGS